MEAKIQAVIMIITIFCDIPDMTTSEKAARFLHKTKPRANAKINTGQKPFSSGAPESAMMITPVTKMKNGSKAPNAPP